MPGEDRPSVYDVDRDYDVGDEALVEAPPSDEPYAFDAHMVTLRDPGGRIGHHWYCDRCGMWAQSIAAFEAEACRARLE